NTNQQLVLLVKTESVQPDSAIAVSIEVILPGKQLVVGAQFVFAVAQLQAATPEVGDFQLDENRAGGGLEVVVGACRESIISNHVKTAGRVVILGLSFLL